jgi:hypothetical protein
MKKRALSHGDYGSERRSHEEGQTVAIFYRKRQASLTVLYGERRGSKRKLLVFVETLAKGADTRMEGAAL